MFSLNTQNAASWRGRGGGGDIIQSGSCSNPAFTQSAKGHHLYQEATLFYPLKKNNNDKKHSRPTGCRESDSYEDAVWIRALVHPVHVNQRQGPAMICAKTRHIQSKTIYKDGILSFMPKHNVLVVVSVIRKITRNDLGTCKNSGKLGLSKYLYKLDVITDCTGVLYDWSEPAILF